MRTACLLVWICLAALALSACSTEGDDMGIVARVNGKPIYLSQLEFQHDLLHMDGSGAFVPTVEVLREEYGRILGDLIVLEMVSQELDSRGLGVTEDELIDEEQKVRADYPEDTFEQVLVEEYIDLAAWRERLRYHRALQKFQQLVLRPQIRIDYREAETYYKQHIKEFQLPETLRVLVLRSADKGPLISAIKTYRETENFESVQQNPNVTVHEIMVRQSQLSSPWLEALQVLPPGEASQIFEEKFGYEALVLLERLPAKLLDPTQAYPLVEQVLLERKLNEAFEIWLGSAWGNTSVQVSEHLLPRAPGAEPVVTEETLLPAAGQPTGNDPAGMQSDEQAIGQNDAPLEQEENEAEEAAAIDAQAK